MDMYWEVSCELSVGNIFDLNFFSICPKIKIILSLCLTISGFYLLVSLGAVVITTSVLPVLLSSVDCDVVGGIVLVDVVKSVSVAVLPSDATD